MVKKGLGSKGRGLEALISQQMDNINDKGVAEIDFALEGMEQLFHTISLVQSRLNPSLEIEGVVFTMYDSRTNLSLEVVEEVKKVLSPSMYSAIIPRNVRLGEAPSYGLPITVYDTRSKGAESYRALAETVISKEWK